MANDVTLTQGYATMTSTKNLTTSDSITVGSKTYLVKGTITTTNDIHLGTDETSTLANIIATINGTGSAGTDYYTGTVGPTDIYAALQSTHVIRFYAAFPGAWVNNCTIAEVVDGGSAYTVGAFATGAGAIGTTGGWVERLLTLNQVNSEVQAELKKLTKAAD